MPVHQNLLCGDRRSAVAVERGNLVLVVCEECGFVSNAAFDASRLAYGVNYENSQYSSPAFQEHTAGLVDHLVERKAVRNARVLEIGCGNGLFLRALVERDRGNVGLGIDPSYRGPASGLDGRLRFQARFYGPEVRSDADVVICRHVIEHVPEPLAMLTSVRRTLESSSRATVYFETPTIDWILKHQAVWDLYYEHCSYFSASSLRHAFQLAAFDVVEIRHLFGGQYLWIEARAAEERKHQPAPGARDQVDRALAFGRYESNLVRSWHERVQRLSRMGGVALWGAGAKGVTFANLVDPKAELVACVVDLNARKQGHFLPGSGHPIIGPAELVERGIKSAVVMNPNYRNEIAMLLDKAGIALSLIDLAADQQPC